MELFYLHDSPWFGRSCLNRPILSSVYLVPCSSAILSASRSPEMSSGYRCLVSVVPANRPLAGLVSVLKVSRCSDFIFPHTCLTKGTVAGKLPDSICALLHASRSSLRGISFQCSRARVISRLNFFLPASVLRSIPLPAAKEFREIHSVQHSTWS